MTAHLLSNFLPLESVQLGRLVLNAKSPHKEGLDPLAGRPAEQEFTQNLQKPFEETREFSKSSKLRPHLGKILSFSCEREHSSIATLSAPQATTYDLKDSESWFESACAQPETRRFLESAIDNRRNIYLIVGFRTIQGGKVVNTTTSKKRKVVKDEIPLHLLSTKNKSSKVVSNTADPRVGGSRDTEIGGEHTYEVPGEQVFAVLYRKVKFKWLSSRSISNMPLEQNNRWKSFWDWRGPDEEDDDEDDVLEANLTDVNDSDISNDESISEDETSYPQEERPTTKKGFEQVNRTPEKEDSGILEANPSDTSHPDIIDEGHPSDNDADCTEEEPPALVDTKEATEQVHNPHETRSRSKRKRAQESTDENPKRLRMEMAAAEKNLRALKARKKALKRSTKRQKSVLSGKGDRRARTKPKSN